MTLPKCVIAVFGDRRGGRNVDDADKDDLQYQRRMVIFVRVYA